MTNLDGGSLNGFRPACDGSMGELTAVASANRAVRGDFNDGAFSDRLEEVSSEPERARAPN